ncbi:hypothetical protein TTHERM_00609490 (macronuclear) [Tetrahymena thermophila SB210]|uniref:Uncharacterized protein n=1 Tax=Tetrahymena thermophila (strain SB210) TaxID=312017 RepID=Q22YE0_TETTS|nr:hypothetical protein TTHERM_00609490 [Tetrahymena thermophila SB210]EAR90345.1 hypothetical protein TTHERM_00609490 [Tetrahymena thermophila SB210]|eukprot:XP_001010590.1 hypothetical protein TTHERM_00609490 [Tetrahymena thermophila SB210]
MHYSNIQEEIIVNNILYLAKKNKKLIESERNLLNKWFQDSIKSYILESTASTLIYKYLRLKSSADVRAFIHKHTDKYKPKYMSIIEQYFIYINQCNQKDHFLKNLNKILMDPVDITHLNTNEQNYIILKTVRKQFVCLLILKYFEIFGQLEIPSFYELWNTFFPQAIQIKKKRSKFDKLHERKMPASDIKNQAELNNSLQNSSDSFINQTSFDFSTNQNLSNQKELPSDFSSSQINNFDQQNLQQSEEELTYQKVLYSQKQPINNKIFEEDSYQQESMSHFLELHNNYHKFQYMEDLSNQNICQQNYLENNEQI